MSHMVPASWRLNSLDNPGAREDICVCCPAHCQGCRPGYQEDLFSMALPDFRSLSARRFGACSIPAGSDPFPGTRRGRCPHAVDFGGSRRGEQLGLQHAGRNLESEALKEAIEQLRGIRVELGPEMAHGGPISDGTHFAREFRFQLRGLRDHLSGCAHAVRKISQSLD
jgi:hypothetical protein